MARGIGAGDIHLPHARHCVVLLFLADTAKGIYDLKVFFRFGIDALRFLPNIQEDYEEKG